MRGIRIKGKAKTSLPADTVNFPKVAFNMKLSNVILLRSTSDFKKIPDDSYKLGEPTDKKWGTDYDLVRFKDENSSYVLSLEKLKKLVQLNYVWNTMHGSGGNDYKFGGLDTEENKFSGLGVVDDALGTEPFNLGSNVPSLEIARGCVMLSDGRMIMVANIATGGAS